MTGKSVPKFPPNVLAGERLLKSLAGTLDLEKSIKELHISKEEARQILLYLAETLAQGPSAARVKEHRAKKAALNAPGAVPASKRPSSAGAFYDLFVDGGSRGNPGPSGGGAVIKDPSGKVVKRLKKRLGLGTNNRAEYMALIMALEAARGLGAEKVRIFADSQLMVRQVTGRYRVKSPALQPLYRKVMALLAAFKDYRISHIPREKNSEADGLANEAMDHGA